MTVFDTFQEMPYTFLEISRGTVEGNVITASHDFMGIVKLRENDMTTNNIETPTSNSTIHAHPDDILSLVSLENIIGQGISVDGAGYFEITNCTTGYNYATGQLEHLTFTLQKAEFIDGLANNDN